MRQFERYMESCFDIPGWFDSSSIALWDVLLTQQIRRGVTGHLVEIGVWKGRSAVLMALHCESNERCIFIDLNAMDEAVARIQRVAPSAECMFLIDSSYKLAHAPQLMEAAGKVRWLHIDGEHTSEAVTNDLQIADMLLGRGGIVVLDDFFSIRYPQVTQAVFGFLANNPHRLTMVLCGFNKAYLCRPTAARKYLEFIKECLSPELAERGNQDITIWKTTEPGDMNTFGISQRESNRNFRGPDWEETMITI